jgi:hypothetical protein
LKFDKFNIATLTLAVKFCLIEAYFRKIAIEGNLKKPNINGRLYLDDAGIDVPYLNVDYALSDNTIIDFDR